MPSEREKVLEAALEIIAGKRQCLDNLMSNQEIADRALAIPADDSEPQGESLLAEAVKHIKWLLDDFHHPSAVRDGARNFLAKLNGENDADA